MDYCEELLTKINEIFQSQSSMVNAPQTEYNIFHTLGVSVKEVIMCRFLADLLNPEGQHHCGILFLKTFLTNVLPDVIHKDLLNDTLLNHTVVETEFTIHDSEAIMECDKRRIDIVIYNSRFFIPIEVKIGADEQKAQCYDYYEFALKKHSNATLVYLTEFGKFPTKYSRKASSSRKIVRKKKIKCISWAEDIYNWLKDLLPQIAEPAKTTVMQYIDAVHSIADKEAHEMNEDCAELLIKSTDFFNAGLQVEKSMRTAKVKLIRMVFDDFKEQIGNLLSQHKYSLRLEKNYDYYYYENESHNFFYDSSKGTYPGLNYVVKKEGNDVKFENKNLQMWFRIEIEENLLAGFTIFDTANEAEVDNIDDKLAKEASQYLKKDILMPVGWWLAWCYSNGKCSDGYYNDVPDFKHMNPCAVSLVDKNERKRFVQNAVKVFEEHLLKYLK